MALITAFYCVINGILTVLQMPKSVFAGIVAFSKNLRSDKNNLQVKELLGACTQLSEKAVK